MEDSARRRFGELEGRRFGLEQKMDVEGAILKMGSVGGMERLRRGES